MATTAVAPISYPHGPGEMNVVQWREWSATCSGRTPGVVYETAQSLEVWANGSGMEVKVRPGAAYVGGTFGRWTGDATLDIAEAPVTAGHSRVDLIVARSLLAASRMEVAVITGDPGEAPDPPELTNSGDTWEELLGHVVVTAGDANVASSAVTDARRWARSVGTTLGKVEWFDSLAAIPLGWLVCDGRSINPITYRELVAARGGAASLPDLRGKVLAALDDMGTGAAGRLSGLTNPAAHYGRQFHAITAEEMPKHVHTGTTDLHLGHGHDLPAEWYLGGKTPGSTDLLAKHATNPKPATDQGGVHGHAFTTAEAGGGQPMSMMQPTNVGYWAICARPVA